MLSKRHHLQHGCQHCSQVQGGVHLAAVRHSQQAGECASSHTHAGGGADFGAAQPMAQLEAMNALAAALTQAHASAGSGDAAQAAQAVSQAVQAAQNAGAPLPAGLQQAAARLRAQAPAANVAQPKKLVVPAWVTDFVAFKVVSAHTPKRVQLYVASWPSQPLHFGVGLHAEDAASSRQHR